MMAGPDFIKTSTGKGERERHPAGQPRHGARHPGILRNDGL